MADPIFDGKKWVAKKDPDDIGWYKFGLARDLTDRNTTPRAENPLVAICDGVELVAHPSGGPNLLFVGTDAHAFLGGLDLTSGADNFCTIRTTCANGEQFDRTMWFVREDH